MSKWKTSSAIAIAVGLATALAASAQEVTIWRSPSCRCCGLWARHLEAAGMSVKMIDSTDRAALEKERGVPPRFASCHTAIVEGYTIEGHVPAGDIERLLAERPNAIGLSVPGMPSGSPGMESGSIEPYDVLLVGRDRSTQVFAHHP